MKIDKSLNSIGDWLLQSDGNDEAVKKFIESYRCENVTLGYIRMSSDLLSHVTNLPVSNGLDFGCAFGFSTLILQLISTGRVTGSDVNPHYIKVAERWRRQFNYNRIRFMTNDKGVIPLESETVDWIICNNVWYMLQSEDCILMQQELTRLLKSGGWLFFSDSNNPHCPEVLARLQKHFRQSEIGTGSLDAPNGPNFRARLNIIRECAPDYSEGQLQRLARGTCYLFGNSLRDAVEAFRNHHVMPESFFEDNPRRSTVNPSNGLCQGNITDPYEISRAFESLGLTTRINTCPKFESLTPAEIHKRLSHSQGFYLFAKKG